MYTFPSVGIPDDWWKDEETRDRLIRFGYEPPISVWTSASTQLGESTLLESEPQLSAPGADPASAANIVSPRSQPQPPLSLPPIIGLENRARDVGIAQKGYAFPAGALSNPSPIDAEIVTPVLGSRSKPANEIGGVDGGSKGPLVLKGISAARVERMGASSGTNGSNVGDAVDAGTSNPHHQHRDESESKRKRLFKLLHWW